MDIIALKYLLKQMEKIQQEYSKCRVEYNFERKQIVIIAPIPKDFYKITNIEITNFNA